MNITIRYGILSLALAGSALVATGCGSAASPAASAPQTSQAEPELPPPGDCSGPMIAGFNDRGHLLESSDPAEAFKEFAGAAACGDARGLYGTARTAEAMGMLNLAVRYSLGAITKVEGSEPPLSGEELQDLLAFNTRVTAALTAAEHTKSVVARPKVQQSIRMVDPNCDIECEEHLREELRRIEGTCPDTSDMSIPVCARAKRIHEILGE